MPKEPLYEAGLEAIHILKQTVEIVRACPDEADQRSLNFQAKLVMLSQNTGWAIPEIEKEAQRISLLSR